MNIQRNASLKPYNTFNIEAGTPALVFANDVEDVKEALEYCKQEFDQQPFILGGGSNILFINNLKAPVIKVEVSGIAVLKEDDDHIYFRVGAGENWHQWVMRCANAGYGGIENLALIPGNVGASPMQNIGAYGAEVGQVLEAVHTIHRETAEPVVFSKEACKLGYRESIFKSSHKDQFIITHVDYRLNKKPNYNISYGAVAAQLEAMGVEALSPKAVAEAVIKIRESKLPNPSVLGNAGSFFKNPTINADLHQQLKTRFPELVSYPAGNGFKVAAGWLIEQCGWKGFRRDDAGCHALQALVLVNYNNATGSELLSLSREIQKSVEEKFGLKLEREVNVAGEL